MKTKILTGAALALLAAVLPASADPAAGRAKAQMCQVCHGFDGLGKNPDVPNIAGDSPNYLVRQLKAFRSGERKHEQMTIIASGLSDQDIQNLADYYAAITVTATVPNL